MEKNVYFRLRISGFKHVESQSLCWYGSYDHRGHWNITFYGNFDPVLNGVPLSGDYDAKFWFADDDIDNYPSAQISYPITVGSSSGGCNLEGDLNSDGLLNIQDVVLIIELILESE